MRPLRIQQTCAPAQNTADVCARSEYSRRVRPLRIQQTCAPAQNTADVCARSEYSRRVCPLRIQHATWHIQTSTHTHTHTHTPVAEDLISTLVREHLQCQLLLFHLPRSTYKGQETQHSQNNKTCITSSKMASEKEKKVKKIVNRSEEFDGVSDVYCFTPPTLNYGMAG